MGVNHQALERTCDICGAPFTTRYVRQVHCSVRCANVAGKRRQYAAGSRRHFPRVRYRAKLAIAARDGWRCGICRAAIDPALRWPHPGSLSIDHIDPHGAHEPANWQASHLACNVEKGARAA